MDERNIQYSFTGDTSSLRSAVKDAVALIKDAFSSMDKAVKPAKDSIAKTTKEVDGLSASLLALRKTIKLLISLGIVRYLAKAVSSSVSYIERLNLFTVATQGATGEMKKFVNTMSEALGLDPSTLIKTSGIFYQFSTAMGVAADQAKMLSKNFTMAAIDIASLFEITVDDAVQKLEAGLVGLPKALRDIGIAVTNASLQQEAYRLGITQSVRTMSEVNKIGLRYISIMRQMKNAMGDFARTIESPANQLRVLKEQLALLNRAIGNLFIGTLSQILPYINGFIMAVRTLVQMLADFLGYKDMTFENSLGGVSSAVGAVTDEVEGATAAAKKLLAPFDELNVLSESSSTGAGAGMSFDMDPRIIAAMKDYDNLMGSVQMKANKVRDYLMEILGFTKNINEETGEITWSWNFQDMKKGLLRAVTDAFNWFKNATWGERFAAIFTAGWVAWLGSKAIGLIMIPFKGIFAKLAAAIPELFASMSGPLATAVEGISGAFSGIVAAITPTMVAISAAVLAVVVAIIDLWRNSEGFRESVITTFNNIKQHFMELVNAVITLGAKAAPAVKMFVDSVVNYFRAVGEEIKVIFQLALDIVLSLWTSFKDGVAAIVINILQVLDGLLVFLTGIFTADWRKALEGMQMIAKANINGIIGVFEAFFNFLIRGFNDLIRQINKIKFSAPDWVPGIGGKSWGINIPSVSTISLPRLATGGIVGSGQLFEAGEKGKTEVIGDYSGKTTVMPLENTSFVSAMQQAVTAGVVGGLSGQAKSSDAPIKVIIGGRDWDTMIYKSYERGKTQIGSALSGGVFNV